MNRLEVVNRQLALARDGAYLEIGVRTGKTFWAVNARTRVGVDPALVGRRLAAHQKWSAVKRTVGFHKGIQLYAETSDTYFARRGWIAGLRYDCVLVDGLHTAEQAYRDVENALLRLAPGGLIVMHDCNPPDETRGLASEAEARRRPDWNGSWNGDVWKAVVRLRTRKDLAVTVIDADEGLGIVQKATPTAPLVTLSEAAVSQLTFADLERDRVGLLNLRAPDELSL